MDRAKSIEARQGGILKAQQSLARLRDVDSQAGCHGVR